MGLFRNSMILRRIWVTFRTPKVSRRSVAARETVSATSNSRHFNYKLTSKLCATTSLLSLTPTSQPPSMSLLFSVILGLPLALWTYKCLVMVLFQRKVIYMGYIPPGTRQEKLSDVPNLSSLQKKYNLEETQISSSGRVMLSTLVMSKYEVEKPDCVVLYLQGNAGNPLHRIPVFTSLLSSTSQLNPIILAPAPRSYWSSTNRTPTEQGLIADYSAALYFASHRWPDTPIVMYGHSLGGAIAVCLLASLDSPSDSKVYREKDNEVEGLTRQLQGLVLENPFASIPGMVHTLYPQRWLPYRYLAPLAWDKWDALNAMRNATSGLPSTKPALNPSNTSGPSADPIEDTKVLPRLARNMLVLISSRDEVVPPSMGRAIFDARPLQNSMSATGGSKLVEINRALHEDAWRTSQWRQDMGRYLEKVVYTGR